MLQAKPSIICWQVYPDIFAVTAVMSQIVQCLQKVSPSLKVNQRAVLCLPQLKSTPNLLLTTKASG